MNHRNAPSKFDPLRIIKKFFLSAFVVVTFIAYALHKPNETGSGSLGLATTPSGAQVPPQPLTPTEPARPGNTSTVPATVAPFPTLAPSATTNPPPATSAPRLNSAPTPTNPAPLLPNTASQSGQYKDGTYTGPEVDATYGFVQVQTIIKNGKIADVQFLEYPNDRRTSIRINSYAVPTLQQEAIQAQSANVNLITGATLTSEAFQMSLQAALSKAKGTA